MTQPSYTVDEFAFVDDDGSETGSTFHTSDTDISQAPGTANRMRIRIQLHNDNNKAGAETFDWEYRYEGGSWTPINDTDSSYVRAIASQNSTWTVSNGDDCTNRLTSQTPFFGTGNTGWSADGSSVDGGTIPAANYLEVELCYYLIEESGVVNSDTIDLRIVENGGDTVTMTDFPQTVYEIAATASDSQPGYIHGLDTASDSQSAYIAGGVNVTSSQSAYISGLGITSDSQPAFVQGEDTAADSQPAFIQGEDTAADSQPAYIAGTDTAAGSQPAFVQGQSTASDAQSAYVEGIASASSSQSAYIEGDSAVSDYIPTLLDFRRRRFSVFIVR